MSYASMLVLELQNMVRALAYDMADDGRSEGLHARVESEDGAWSASTDIAITGAEERIRELLSKAIESKLGPRFRFTVFGDVFPAEPAFRRTRVIVLAGTS